MDHQQYNARTSQGLNETANSKQQALSQVSELKRSNLPTQSETAVTNLDPQAARLNDLNTLEYNAYRAKYGFDADTANEYVRHKFTNAINPILEKEEIQRTADSQTGLDVAADSLLGVASGASNLVGGGAAFGLGAIADPASAVGQGLNAVKEFADDFVGADTDYADLIIGQDSMNHRTKGVFSEAEENVREFLKENGVTTGSELNVLNATPDNLVQDTLKEASGIIFEATDAVADWIKSGQSDALTTKTQLRAEENEQYRNELKSKLGEDSTWYENASTNAKILGNSFFNLVQDPAAATIMIAESVPSLLGAGSIAKQVSDKSLDKALKEKSKSIIEEVKANNGDHLFSKELINAELKKAEVKPKDVQGAVSAETGAVVASGFLEGSGAATEAYNLIIDTDFDTLNKASDRFNALVKEGNSEEESRKLLATESAMGAGVAVMAIASGITKVSGAADVINRTYGTTKSAMGVIPRSVQMTFDAGKEGIEETFQSFIGSAATGVVKRENIDPSTDVYGEAAIAAGEGALAGVGTSAALSTPRAIADGINTAKKGSKEFVQKAGKSTRKAKSIKDNGITPADVDVNHTEFEFTATIQGIKARNNVEGIAPEEIQKNVDEAGLVINDYIDQLEILNESLGEPGISEKELKNRQAKMTKAKENVMSAYNVVEEMRTKLEDKNVSTDVQSAVEGDTEAATRVMGSMAISPNTVSEEQVKALLDSGNLDDAQAQRAQDHLNVIESLKTLDEVNSDVLFGGDGFMGIQQYLDTIGSSVRTKNVQGATKVFQALDKFAKRHTQKAKDFTAAYAVAQIPRRERTADQQAILDNVNMNYPNKDATKQTIHPGTPVNLIETVGHEANALQDAVKYAQGSIDYMLEGTTEASQEAPVEETQETDAVESVQEDMATEEVTEPVNETIEETVNEETSSTESTAPEQNDVQVEEVRTTEPVNAESREVQQPEVTTTERIDAALEAGSTQEAADLINQVEFEQYGDTGTKLKLFAKGEYLQGFVEPKSKEDKNSVIEAYPNKEARYEAFLKENLVSKYFRVKGKVGRTLNPITQVDNLMEDMLDNANDLITRYTEIKEVRSNHIDLLSSLKDHHTDFSDSLKNVYSTKDVKRNQNMVRYFEDSEGNLPQEVIAAMSVGTFNWVATSAGSTLFNTVSDVRRILNLSDDQELSMDTYLALKSGGFRTDIASEIGKNIYKALNLTQANDNVPGNMKSQLENSLGLLAVAALRNQGFISIEDKSQYPFYDDETKERFDELAEKFPDTYNKFQTDGKVSNPTKNPEIAEFIGMLKQTVSVVTPASVKGEEFDELNPVLQNIVNVNKDTDSLLSKMFKVEDVRKGPTKKPVKGAPKKVRNTRQDIGEEYSEIIVKHNALEHYLKQDQVEEFSAMSTGALRQMLGYNSDLDGVQKNRLDSVNSANRSINASINFMKEALEDGSLDGTFYFEHDVIKNQRLLLNSTSVNPQADKLHRHLIKIKGQDSTIDLNSEDMTDYNNFLIAFGQAMKVKIDKQLESESLKKIHELLEEPVVIDAINAINSRDGEYTPEQEVALLAGIKRGGEKTWSMDGLVAMARYIKAKQNGDSTFTHDLMIEADGITNGPAIGTLQFGIGNNLQDVIKRLNMVGINEKGNTTEYGEYISKPLNLDNYETITTKLNEALNELEPAQRKIAEFGLFLLGDLVKTDPKTGAIELNRNISKNPLMTTIYGAGKKSIKTAMGNAVIDEFYKYLEDNANNPEKLKALAIAAKTKMGITFEKGEISNNPLEYTLEPQVKNYIQNNVSETLGTAMLDAIDAEYGQFKERTKYINESMGIVAETFQKVFSHARDAKIKEMIDQGILAAGKTGALELLPEKVEMEILESLVEAQPIVQSVMSAQSKATKEGLFVGKESKSVSDKIGLQVRQSYSDSAYPSASMRGKELEFISGGASPVVLMVQNIDATTMMRLLRDKSAFNVYDAHISGVDKAIEHTQNINKHFYEINKNHSISQEAVNAFNRAEKAVQDYDAANGTNFAESFNQENTEFLDGEKYTYSVRDRLDSSNKESLVAKQRTIDIIGRVGQYGWENGSYVVGSVNINLVDESLKLGSAPVDGEVQYSTETEKLVNDMTATEVFNELSKVGSVTETPEHSQFLFDSVNELKAKLTEPLKLKLRDVLSDTMANIEGNDIVMYTQMFGGQKGSTGILNSGLRMSAQEAYVHELWHAISRHGIEGNTPAKKELIRRWEQAKNSITPFDLMDKPELGENSPEYKEAKASWDYIFTARNDLTKTITDPVSGNVQTKVYSNHLHEFAAYSMTNAKFIAALKRVEDKAPREESVRLDDGSFLNSLYNKMLDLIGSIADMFSTYLTNTKGKPQDVAVQELVKQLANIEGKNKNLLLSTVDTLDNYSGKVSGLVGSVAKAVANPVIELANSKKVRDSKSIAISLPGRLVRLANNYEEVGMVFDALNATKLNLNAKKEKFNEQLITEAKGYTDNFKNFHTLSRMKTKLVDRAVVELQGTTETLLTKAFGDLEPTKEEAEAITKAFLKTDLSSLGIPLSRVVKLLESPATVSGDIAKILKPLKNDPNYDHYVYQAKALGNFMVTGKVTSEIQNYNAYQIANMFGTGKTNPNAKSVEKSIDMLATLYAVQYSDKVQKARLAEFIKKNEAMGTDNGMEYLRRFHLKQKETDLKEIFDGSEANVMKGHTRDIFDPNIKAVLLTEEDGKEYEARGWVKQPDLFQDPMDSTEPLYMYVDTHGGDTRTIGAIISFTSKQAKGTDTVKRRQIMGDKAPIYSGGKDANKIFMRKEVSYRSAVKNADRFDPTKATNGMAPLFDLQGRITGYRYLMTEANKDRVLNRNNNAISVLAKGAGSTLNKVQSNSVNVKTIQALKDHFDSSPTGEYLALGPNTQDTELKDIYARLPKETKRAIRDIWGKDTMLVDKKILTMIFGYRKFSIADQLALDKAQQHVAIQFLGSVNTLLGKPWNYSAEQVARSTGQYWQEYVSMVKDFLIIKSGIVTLINTISNTAQLYTEGLSAVNLIKYQKEAVVEVSKYRQQMAELNELEKLVELGLDSNNLRRNQARIYQLKAAISANPVTDVIEDGLLQNIVEDVALVEDEYSKGGKISEFLDKKVYTKVPGYIREAGREVFLTHDSYLYKKMSQSAQLSDFMARYALYKHNVEKGMARDDAANNSISTFINYDLPTHKGIQYLNDMGILWFTKYYIRIQKILAKTLANNPSRVMSLLMLDFMSGDSIATVYDTAPTIDNVMNRVGLPSPPHELISDIASTSLLPY